eukprot:snap_masked-scaffold_1-processed-gene-28.24-mRNA-1 protein AED:1.00 eAED:1.00 QI:0/0/0/0/1/1/2/0/73
MAVLDDTFLTDLPADYTSKQGRLFKKRPFNNLKRYLTYDHLLVKHIVYYGKKSKFLTVFEEFENFLSLFPGDC